MEAISVCNKKPGDPAEIVRGIYVPERVRLALGGMDRGSAGAVHVPLSTKLQQALPADCVLANASVMRAPTSLKLLATECVDKDKAGAVLVLINIEPREGETVAVTDVELTTHRCHYQGGVEAAEKVCDDCGTQYVKETPDASVFTHPKSGYTSSHRTHLPHQVKVVGEGTHLVNNDMTHKEILAVMEPGARIRIATVRGGKAVSEQVLVRTHTELDFAAPGNIYLQSELNEENAAYV